MYINQASGNSTDNIFCKTKFHLILPASDNSMTIDIHNPKRTRKGEVNLDIT